MIQGEFGGQVPDQGETNATTLTEVPKPPSHLNRYGKAKWKELLVILIREGRVTEADLTSIELMCDAYGEYREAKAAIYCMVDEVDADGYKTGKRHRRKLAEYLKDRNSQTAPELAAMNKAFTNYDRLAKDFGLSPTGRKRGGIKEPPKQDNPFRAYIDAMNRRLAAQGAG